MKNLTPEEMNYPGYPRPLYQMTSTSVHLTSFHRAFRPEDRSTEEVRYCRVRDALYMQWQLDGLLDLAQTWGSHDDDNKEAMVPSFIIRPVPSFCALVSSMPRGYGLEPIQVPRRFGARCVSRR